MPLVAHIYAERLIKPANGLRSRLVGWAGRALMALVVALAFLGPIAKQAHAAVGITTKAKQAILIDVDSGAVLFQHNADELMPPASMSKLMTLAVVFRAIRAGQLRLDDKFLMSEDAWRRGGAPSRTAAMFVPVNTTETLENLIKGIIIQSGNDASIAIAQGMARDEATFAKMMTKEARRIGMTKSTFANATGLYHTNHLMTARELAKLATFLMKEYPEFYPLFGQREFRYRKHRFRNRNPLLFLDLGVDGLKTGYVKKAGYGVVASAKQNGRRLLLVINGLKTKAQRKREGRKLLRWGFRTFKEFKLYESGDVIGKARVWGGQSIYVPLTGNGAIKVLLPRFPANQKLKAEIVYNAPLKPPVRAGDKVAMLRVTSSAKAVNEVPLYAAENVPRAGLVRRGLDSLAYLAFGWLP